MQDNFKMKEINSLAMSNSKPTLDSVATSPETYPVEHPQEDGASFIACPNRELQSNENQQRLLGAALAATANSIVITDCRGVILWTNPAFTKLTGYLAEEIVGQTPRVLRSGKHSPEFYKQMWDVILSRNVWSGEVINRRKDGSLYTEEMTITPIRSDTGEEPYFVAVKQDVTERKLMEEQFRQAQKMEAVGRLAGGIAHDFNNLLCVIGRCAEIVEDQSSDEITMLWVAGEIRTAVRSAAALTNQLLAFGRKQLLQPKVQSLNLVVSETVNMLRRVVGEDIILVLDLDPGAGNVMADVVQLQQVIMNLAVNARDAMPKGGRLTISTRNVDSDRDFVESGTRILRGRYIKLTLHDNGLGMDAETQRRAFEPFFTTKRQGQGTGLGLSTVFGIVKQSGGYVVLSSEVGVGTFAEVFLRRVDEEPEVRAIRLVAGEPESISETILLVEDYRSLQRMIRTGLERKGYKVIVAQDGREGIEVARSYNGAIHLLVTDVIMPGMDGLQLAECLAKERPCMSVLYMSGHTDEMVCQHGVLSSDVALIKKPFEMPVFLAKVREALQLVHRDPERNEPSVA